MRRIVETSQKTAVNHRMQGFNTSIEDLWETRHVRHRDYRDSGFAQCIQGAPGREQLPPKAVQLARKIHNPRLVIDTDQRSHRNPQSFRSKNAQPVVV